MDSRAKFLGHATHPMLIVFPLGLFPVSFIFDLVAIIGRNPLFSVAAFWTMVAGIVGGLAAAVFGWIDWYAVPDKTRAKRLGLLHGVGNVAVVGVFVVSLFLRGEEPAAPPVSAVVLSGLGNAMALVTGWMGGELVERLGVGVDAGANLNAPSSLKHKSLEPIGKAHEPTARK